MPAFNMRDYITVAERLTQSQDELAHLQTDPPVMLTDTVGYIRVTITLKTSRTATGIGGFRLDLQGKGPEVTDPLEKAETTAIGRALKHLGYGVSREEMERAAHNQQVEHAPPPARTQERNVSKSATFYRRLDEVIKHAKAIGIDTGALERQVMDDALTDQEIIDAGKRLKAEIEQRQAPADDAAPLFAERVEEWHA
jgi:hypothetical protein